MQTQTLLKNAFNESAKNKNFKSDKQIFFAISLLYIGRYIHSSQPYRHVHDNRELGKYTHIPYPYDGGYGPYNGSNIPYMHVDVPYE